jgi:ribosomal protein S2
MLYFPTLFYSFDAETRRNKYSKGYMTNLEKLYQSLHNLQELGLSLNDDMQDEVDKIEKELIEEDIIPRLTACIGQIFKYLQCPVTLMVKYKPDESLRIELLSVGYERKNLHVLTNKQQLAKQE